MNLLMIHLIVGGICGALGNSVLTDCQVTISTVNWTVSGSCRVEQNVSNYNYSCEWELDNERTSVGQSDSGDELCSFTQPLELTEDTYNYRVHFSPSSAAAVSGEVKIAKTGNSTKFRPQVLECGANLTCSCLTTTQDSEKLVKTNVQREDNGTQFTCHVTWAGRVYISITYTLLVESVEGPSDVVISETYHPGNNCFSVVTVLCNTTGVVYPGVNFTWSPGVCHNETHASRSSTCTFTVDAKDDGKSVTCTAINSIDSRISVSTSVTLRINGAGNISVVLTSGSQSSASAVVGPIVGAVVAGVVAVVIAVLIVILIRRRRQKIKKTSNKLTKSSPCKESEFEDHINEVYDSSETAGPHSSCGDNYRSRGQGTDREASDRNKQEVSAQYEDSPSGGYYSEIREVGTGNTYPQPHHRLSMNPYSN